MGWLGYDMSCRAFYGRAGLPFSGLGLWWESWIRRRRSSCRHWYNSPVDFLNPSCLVLWVEEWWCRGGGGHWMGSQRMMMVPHI